MKKYSDTKRTPPPPKQSPAPSKQTPEQPILKILQDSLISGFGFGIGNGIANNLINKTSSPPQTDSYNCNNLITDLDTCILLNRDCSDLYTKLKLNKCYD
jgi:hypothetical protein